MEVSLVYFYDTIYIRKDDDISLLKIFHANECFCALIEPSQKGFRAFLLIFLFAHFFYFYQQKREWHNVALCLKKERTQHGE